MKKVVTILFVFIGFLAISQAGKLKRANNYYEKLAYTPASKLYTELIGSDIDSPEMKSKLAHCFYLTGKLDDAEKIYSQLFNGEGNSTIDIYRYAQTLKQNGKYSESDKWMKKYYSLEQSDSRGREFIENENYIEKIQKNGNKFSIANLDINTEDSDFGSYFYNNKFFFLSNRPQNPYVKNIWQWSENRFLDLYVAEFNQDNVLRNSKVFTKRVNTKFHEGPLTYTVDGKKVFFTRNNIAKGYERRDQKGIQNLKIYIADIDENGNWFNEKEFEYTSKDYSIGHPCISNDGKYLYFVSDMPGGFGGADIYRVAISDNYRFGKPENLGKTINTEGHEMFPFINNENLLFYSSDGHLGLGGLDIFVGIPDSNLDFNRIINAGKLINSSRDDFAFIMTKDNMNGFFSSNRIGGKGEDDIYSFKLDKPYKIGIELKGTVNDIVTDDFFVGIEVFLKDSTGKIIETAITNDKGEFSFNLDENKTYFIESSKEKYSTSKNLVSTKNLYESSIQSNLKIAKIPDVAIYCLVSDNLTKKPLKGVNLKINEINSKERILSVLTPISGDVYQEMEDLKIGDELNYEITISKPGYLTKTVTFKHYIDQPGVINIHEFIDLSIGLMTVGGDLAKLIDVKPIYFDLGKFYIRPDAQIELNKIIKVMNEYPNMVVELGSHTDCRSSKAFNLKLSDNRAKASATYIKARISKPERIYGRGYGESKLINDCSCEDKIVSRNCSEEEHQENRRTEFIIKKIGASKVSVNTNVEPTTAKLVFDPNKKFHIVEDTDNLYIISVNNGVTVEEIMKLNNMTSQKVIVGQKIILRQ
jgi:outer membrane protein OmpA-like peptidoglycan-associated protein